MRAQFASVLALAFALSACDEAPTRADSQPAPVRLRLERAVELDTAVWNSTDIITFVTTDDEGVVETNSAHFPDRRKISWTLSADLGQKIQIHGLGGLQFQGRDTLWFATADIGTDEPVLDTTAAITLLARPFASLTSSVASRSVADFVLFSPSRESFINPVSIRMATRTAGASIRYVFGHGNPSQSSLLAPESLLIDGTTTITAIAYHPNMFPSEPSTRTFRFRVDTLRPTEVDSVFPESTSIRWTTSTRGVVLRYRTDDQDPDSTSPELVGAFPIDSPTRTIRLRGFREGYEPSPVFRREFRIVVPAPKLQPPTHSLMTNGVP